MWTVVIYNNYGLLIMVKHNFSKSGARNLLHAYSSDGNHSGYAYEVKQNV